MTSIRRLRIIVDDNIPFIRGRLEAFADVAYADQFAFSPELVADADALIIRTRTRCDAALLGSSRVGMIATATIGTDQIDLDWCAKRGIRVRNAAGCNAPGVAQYVWSALLREGFDPTRHTLGIVGYGNVGSVVGEWADALGCRVVVSDPPREAELRARGVDVRPLAEVCAEADALTLHTPLTRSGSHPTFHLIGDAELSLMRPGSILVNAARGPVADTDSILRAIRTRGLRAIIDVWEGEPSIRTDLLGAARIGTFHIAGYSFEGKQRATRMALEAIGEYFGFNPPAADLTGPYSGRPGIIASEILASYDPAPDDAALRADPAAFDTLRANYNFRHEPRC